MPIDKRELLAALKDAQLLQWLRAQVLQNASSMTIGRFPGTGSAQNDNYVYPDAADANFPYNFDYEIPGNFQRIISARLSFKIRPYRTYSTLTLSATGATVLTTDSTAESGHSHNHNHTMNFVGNITGTANAVVVAGSQMQWVASSNTTDGGATLSNNAAGSSGHSHSHNHGGGGHTHTVSGTTTLGISEDAAPNHPGITVAVDGTDVTATLGGPFNADMVEIDVTQVLKTSAKVWHVMSLQPNQRVRITGILRISYLVDSRVAQ